MCPEQIYNITTTPSQIKSLQIQFIYYIQYIFVSSCCYEWLFNTKFYSFYSLFIIIYLNPSMFCSLNDCCYNTVSVIILYTFTLVLLLLLSTALNVVLDYCSVWFLLHHLHSVQACPARTSVVFCTLVLFLCGVLHVVQMTNTNSV